MMKPKYQAMKKIVPGMTNALFFVTSSWNSGDRSTASQSNSEWCSATEYPSLRLPSGRGVPVYRDPYAQSHLAAGGWALMPARRQVAGASLSSFEKPVLPGVALAVGA